MLRGVVEVEGAFMLQLWETFQNAYLTLAVNGVLFTAIAWNACGLEKCAEDDIVDLLEAEGVNWDAVLI